MKLVSFFSRFAIICNVAFIALLIFQKIEPGGGKDVLAPVPFIKGIIIILGTSAIIVNLIMCIVYSVIVISGRQLLLLKWLVIINFLFLLLQIFYFFFR